MCLYVCSEITECRQSRLPSESKDGRRVRGVAVVADRLVEIKELKIDRHPEEFKDCNMAAFLRGCLKITNHSSTNLHLNMSVNLLYSTERAKKTYFKFFFRLHHFLHTTFILLQLSV